MGVWGFGGNPVYYSILTHFGKPDENDIHWALIFPRMSSLVGPVR